VICLDGCEPEYLDIAISEGLMPNLQRIRKEGTDALAHSVIPSFTNPNNMSIATGRPPSVHGICGNFLFDPETGEEVMMNDVRFLRAPTLFSKYYEGGSRVAVVTAKDKLRALLGAGLEFGEDRAICFSSEKADLATKADNGIHNASEWLGRPVPEVYSADLSEFVLAAGVKILKEWSPNVMYLSTTDYVQHKFAPNQQGAKDFYSMADKYIGELDALGAALVVTADHGMKPKHDANGKPSVIYVQDILDQWLGQAKARVILPITDPYVVHHGALGSFATAYLPAEVDINEITEKLSNLEGILLVINKSEAVKRFELPPDRIGDIVIISTENMTLGTSVDRHDLEALKEPLRSHGGLTEQEVPFIVNRNIDLPEVPNLRNYDAFFYASIAANT
jgi:phosphonoacetate hydrolase